MYEIKVDKNRVICMKDRVHELVLEHIPTGVWAIDREDRFVLYNKAMEEISGVPATSVLGKQFSRVVPSHTLGGQARFIEYFRRARNSKTLVEYERLPILTPAREQSYQSGRLIPVLNADGQYEGMICTVEEVTAVAEMESFLAKARDVVENNVQFMSKVLHLQVRKRPEFQYSELLRENANRLRVISAIHDELFETRDCSAVNFQKYASFIVQKLVRFYECDLNLVCLDMQLDSTPLELEYAVPCGLILHELVSNALKHAFPAGVGGTIEVRYERLARDEKKVVRITVRDDGLGLPANFNWEAPGAMGLYLVRLLARHYLHGTATCDSGPGCEVSVEFPVVPEMN